jgi:hypothetical protein
VKTWLVQAHDTAPVPQEQEGGAGASPRATSGCSPESPAFPSERIPPLRAGAGPSSRSPGTCLVMAGRRAAADAGEGGAGGEAETGPESAPTPADRHFEDLEDAWADGLEAEVAQGVGNAVSLMVVNVAASVCQMAGLDLSCLQDLGDRGGKLLGEEGGSGSDEALDIQEEEDEVYQEESEGQLMEACIRELRASTQVQCEVYVEYCTAARTRGFVPDTLDRTQVDGFTLQGSMEAYEQRYQALRQELVGSGLFPPDRMRVLSNLDCFHVLEAAARCSAPAPAPARRPQSRHEAAGKPHVGESSCLAPQLPKPAASRGAGSTGASQSASGHETMGAAVSRAGDGGDVTGASQTGDVTRASQNALLGHGAKQKRGHTVPYKARSARWGAGTRTLIGNLEATGVGHGSPARHFPRIGSFEVYLRAGQGRAVERVYSKLLLGKFKPMALVLQDICRAVVRAVAGTELSVWLGTYVPPALLTAHPPMLDQDSSMRARDASAAPKSPRTSPRQFKRVFGSMQPRTSLHPEYPANPGQVSPRVHSPQLSPRNGSPRPASAVRVLGLDAQEEEEEASARGAGAQRSASARTSARASASRAAPPRGELRSGIAGARGATDGLQGYREALQHGRTPPEYLSAQVRAGQVDLHAAAQGAARGWGLETMVSACKHALTAVGQILNGSMLSLLEARASSPSSDSFQVLIEVHSLSQSPAQAAAALAREVAQDDRMNKSQVNRVLHFYGVCMFNVQRAQPSAFLSVSLLLPTPPHSAILRGDDRRCVVNGEVIYYAADNLAQEVLASVAHVSKVDAGLLSIICHHVYGEPGRPRATGESGAGQDEEDGDNARHTVRPQLRVGGELLELDLTIHISALHPKLPAETSAQDLALHVMQAIEHVQQAPDEEASNGARKAGPAVQAALGLVEQAAARPPLALVAAGVGAGRVAHIQFFAPQMRRSKDQRPSSVPSKRQVSSCA